jgi:plastocyanin
VAVVAIGAALAGGERKRVDAVGGFSFEPNKFLQIGFRFAPGTTTVRSGQRITFRNRTEGGEPHTVTIVRRSELPRTIDELFNCGAPGTPCELARGHVDENFNPIPGNEVINVGRAGLNTRGDSLFLAPQGEDGDTITAKVSAQPGTNLFYLCAIHAWMQGKIEVRGSADD